jgi:hypothetical protein
MDKKLADRYPVKKETRAGIIAAAIRRMHAEFQVSPNSILKLLWRQAKTPRRPLFKNDLQDL